MGSSRAELRAFGCCMCSHHSASPGCFMALGDSFKTMLLSAAVPLPGKHHRRPLWVQVVMDNGKNVVPEVWEVLDKIQAFSNKVRSEEWLGATGKPLKDVVAIGIGGSFLGPLFVHTALRCGPGGGCCTWPGQKFYEVPVSCTCGLLVEAGRCTGCTGHCCLEPSLDSQPSGALWLALLVEQTPVDQAQISVQQRLAAALLQQCGL